MSQHPGGYRGRKYVIYEISGGIIGGVTMVSHPLDNRSAESGGFVGGVTANLSTKAKGFVGGVTKGL